jgi:threonine dehydrogenase-like Zn-dependent dehydrogenase
MRALIYRGSGLIGLEDVPMPVPGADEVLVKVAAVGICGSDMHAYHGHDNRRPPPLILGHEAAGWIESGPRQGTRVTVNPLVTCGHCDMCRDGRSHLCAQRQIISMPPRPGAFAEFVRIPARNLIAIPDDMPFQTAALAEPLAVAWHAVRIGVETLQIPLAAATSCVIGGGAIGVGASLVLHRFGAAQIALGEPHQARRAAAKSLPVTTYTPGETSEPQPGSIDLVIDAVGAPATREAASRMVKPGGVIVHIGLLPGHGGIDIRRLTLQEITLRGSYCYTEADFQHVVATLAQNGFGSLDWVLEMPLAEGAHAFAALDKAEIAAAKIILTP